jgi:poly-beta-1,6-N-acetyl-D-glucosamine synthase
MPWFPSILILPYILFLLYIIRSLFRIKSFVPSEPGKTYISVVIACRNEQENLPQLLHKLSDQNYPADLFEVIIVDDNSTDNTRVVAERSERPVNIIVLSNKGKGKKEALKTGISMAKGEFIITTDADCMMGNDWLSTISAFRESHNPEMIICPVRLGPMPGFFGRFQELEFLSLQGITAGTASAGVGTMCNGANLAFTKKAYLNNVANLRFDIATGDDVFLLHSMKKQNSKISWLESQEAIIITDPCSDMKSFFKQRKRWASKSSAYKDTFSIILGIVTFVTILTQAVLFIGAIFDLMLMKAFLIVFILKSIPDFIVLLNTTKRYGRKELLNWFLPSQLIYPFYVLIIAGLSVFGSHKEP